MHTITKKVLLSILMGLLSIFWASAEADEYLLEKDDTIKMTVFGEEDLSTTAQIGKTGSVSFPLIGSVKLSGLNLSEAELKIKEAFETDYLQNAQVSLSIVSYAKKWVIVGGEVGNPGTINYPEAGALDLRGAIAQAGGVKENADSNRIIVRRKDGSSSRYSLSKSGGLVLRHGDSITVSRSSYTESSFTVTGEVANKGVVAYPKTGSMDILTAIAQAGGFTAIANKKVVTVRRNKQLISVNIRDIQRGKQKMFYMRPGDILNVKESTF